MRLLILGLTPTLVSSVYQHSVLPRNLLGGNAPVIILALTSGYFSMSILTTGIASSRSSCSAKMTSYFGYDSFIAASRVWYRLLSRPHNGRIMVTPGADDDGIDSSLEGIDTPPYLFRLFFISKLSSTCGNDSRCAKA